MESITTEQYKVFFDNIEVISKRHDDSQTLRNNFNLFSILRRASDEVGLHSRFIYESLNTLHNYNGHVVKYFLQSIGLEEYADFKSIRIHREYDNIDILLMSELNDGNKLAIIIENKVYAGDQDKQLIRYHEKLKDKGHTEDEIKLVYLSLDGKSPSDGSAGHLMDKVICVSYEYNIIEWCNLCIKEFAEEPTVRETFVQYRLLLQKLTGQLGVNMTNALKELILADNKNLEMALNIMPLKEEIYIDLQTKYLDKLFDALAEYKEDDFSCEMLDKKNAYHDYIYKFYKQSKNNKYYGFCFKITISNQVLVGRVEMGQTQCYWGFPTNANLEYFGKSFENSDSTKDLPGFHTSKWWNAYKWIDDVFKPITAELAKTINDDKLLEDHINNIVKNIVEDTKKVVSKINES